MGVGWVGWRAAGPGGTDCEGGAGVGRVARWHVLGGAASKLIVSRVLTGEQIFAILRTCVRWGQGSSTLERLEAEDLSEVAVEAIGEDLKELFRLRNVIDA